MTKTLAEWTLKEIKEMCTNVYSCSECEFWFHTGEYCKIYRKLQEYIPEDWELEEND